MPLLVLLACTSTPPPPGAAPPDPARPGAEMVKPAARDARWEAARCNDGSPFGYGLRRTGSHHWVVLLEGGYFCDDAATPCRARARHLTTTPDGADGARVKRKRHGLFSSDPSVNPDFHDANHVDARYCSSDLWLGAHTTRQPTSGDRARGWFFAGRHNVRALVESLAAEGGLDDGHPDTRVLVVGSSAGGIGLIGNLETFVALLPQTAARGGLLAIFDGAWRPERPWEADSPWDADRWGQVHGGCARALRAAGEDPARCALGTRWWPHLQGAGVPILVQIAGLDTHDFPEEGLADDALRRGWLGQLHTELSQLPWVFSRAEPYHTIAFGPKFAQGPEGRSFRDLVGRFWRGEDPERVLIGYL